MGCPSVHQPSADDDEVFSAFSFLLLLLLLTVAPAPTNFVTRREIPPPPTARQPIRAKYDLVPDDEQRNVRRLAAFGRARFPGGRTKCPTREGYRVSIPGVHATILRPVRTRRDWNSRPKRFISARTVLNISRPRNNIMHGRARTCLARVPRIFLGNGARERRATTVGRGGQWGTHVKRS